MSPEVFDSGSGGCVAPPEEEEPECPEGQSWINGQGCMPKTPRPSPGSSAPDRSIVIGSCAGTRCDYADGEGRTYDSYTPEGSKIANGETVKYNCGGWVCTVGYKDQSSCYGVEGTDKIACTVTPKYTGEPYVDPEGGPPSIPLGDPPTGTPTPKSGAPAPPGYVPGPGDYNPGSTGGPGTGTGDPGTGTGDPGTGTGDPGTGTGDPGTGGTGGGGPLYVRSQRTIAGVLGAFRNSVSQAPFYRGAVEFFNPTIPGGSCAGLSGVIAYQGHSFAIDMDSVFCSGAAVAMYGVMAIAVMLGAVWAAYRIAIL